MSCQVAPAQAAAGWGKVEGACGSGAAERRRQWARWVALDSVMCCMLPIQGGLAWSRDPGGCSKGPAAGAYAPHGWGDPVGPPDCTDKQRCYAAGPLSITPASNGADLAAPPISVKPSRLYQCRQGVTCSVQVVQKQPGKQAAAVAPTPAAGAAAARLLAWTASCLLQPLRAAAAAAGSPRLPLCRSAQRDKCVGM